MSTPTDEKYNRLLGFGLVLLNLNNRETQFLLIEIKGLKAKLDLFRGIIWKIKPMLKLGR